MIVSIGVVQTIIVMVGVLLALLSSPVSANDNDIIFAGFASLGYMKGLDSDEKTLDGLADEGEYRLREDRARAVETLTCDLDVAVLKQVRFDDGLEGGFGMSVLIRHAICSSALLSCAG